MRTLDQANSLHTSSQWASNLLTGETVKRMFLTSTKEVQVAYLDFVAFSHFHSVQRDLLESNADSYNALNAAIEYMQGCISRLDHASKTDEENHMLVAKCDFLDYMCATRTYLDGDMSSLAAALENLSQTNSSTPVINRLLHGLQKHGTINYARHYAFGDMSKAEIERRMVEILDQQPDNDYILALRTKVDSWQDE